MGDFLADYDDNKDDQKYYRLVLIHCTRTELNTCLFVCLFRGSAYTRRRREREMEIDYDERDKMREKDELEELRLQVSITGWWEGQSSLYQGHVTYLAVYKDVVEEACPNTPPRPHPHT